MLGLKRELAARKERKYRNLLQEITTLRETVCSKRETDRDLLKGILKKKSGTCCLLEEIGICCLLEEIET